MTGAALWMDQGGTFTDVLRRDAAGRIHLEKVPSNSILVESDPGPGVAVRRGTTVATNALLEGAGRPVLLLTTAGLGDLAWLGDQRRLGLFDLRPRRACPPCAAVIEVEGRIAANGQVLAPTRVDPARLRAARAQGIDAVAIVLVHGPLAPAEEEGLAQRCREAGFGWVSVGHRIAPSRGFLDRLVTSLVDAATSPLLPRAPGDYMRSDGGLARVGPGIDPEQWRGAQAVLSGPAGGVVAVAALVERLGLGPAFGLDMGGTSADVCRVEGAPERAEHLDIAGLSLRVPTVAVQTVAAGGGSRLSVQAGLYAVGPQSAGADPGPAAYGRGGPATLTDCEVVLGRLPRFPWVCGPNQDQPLDQDTARAAVGALDPTRPVEQVAEGFRELAHATLAGALRRIAATRGVDAADHALVAFGGAGPGHACGVARRLGIRRVLVPLLAGAFSALGIGLARRRAEWVEGLHGGIAAAWDRGRSRAPFPGPLRLELSARFVGTGDALRLPWTPEQAAWGEAEGPALDAAFRAAHRRVHGFDRPASAIEALDLHLSVEEPQADGPWPLAEVETQPEGRTRAHFGEWRDLPLRGLHLDGPQLGPALLVGGGCTLVLEPGWCARPVEGALLLEDLEPAAPLLGPAEDPAALAVFAEEIRATAEQMGERLRRLARSVSTRERLDFSCAVFDARGQLVANAPHVPVHLGAMGETVRDLLARRAPDLRPDQCWMSNDPYAGGSHLPDITVMQPIFSEGALAAFVACRAHHADVGGSSPGSMPPRSRHIDEEGEIWRQQRLSEGGQLFPPDPGSCRQPDTLQADLEAQVAACALGAARIQALITRIGAQGLQQRMEGLMRRAEAAVRRALATRPGQHRAEERLDDGHPIAVTLDLGPDGARLFIDAEAHPGNLNAPTGVARAALLYVLRCLISEDLPLNEGALRAIDLSIRPGGLFDPHHPAAVAGGNVETSQRLVDALLRALGLSAASQGTMNNLAVGTPSGAFYETIGGGSCATPEGPGTDAIQVHMTNTRCTDVEELEHRFPVRLLCQGRRPDSGGAGLHRGGDGTRKEWLFLASCDVTLLAGRRDQGAPGLAGGQAGAPGLDQVDRGEGFEPAPPAWRAKAGDRLRIDSPGGGGFGPPEG